MVTSRIRMRSRRPTEILNFGIGNYNTDQELHLYREKGLKYRPDEVVVFYFINDAEPTPRPSRWEWLSRSRAITLFWSKIKTVKSRVTAGGSWEQYYSSLYADDQPGWLAEQRAFVELKRLCDENRTALRVVLLPELHRLDPYPFAGVHQKVSRFLSEHQIPNLDLAPLFPTLRDSTGLWVALDDAHPNAAAHSLIAKASKEFVQGGLDVPAATK
jgi:hypothetical protein